MNFCRGQTYLMMRGGKKLPPKTDSQIDQNFVHSSIQRNVTESSQKQNASLTALTRKVEKLSRYSMVSDFKTATTTRNPLQICAQITTHCRVKFCRSAPHSQLTEGLAKAEVPQPRP